VDKLNFNADGTIQTVVQTKQGVTAVGVLPKPDSRAIKYEAESGKAAKGAVVETDDAASGSKCVQNLHLVETYLQLDAVDGGARGGRATIGIHYASADNAKLRLSVNGVDYSLLNAPATGGWSDDQGYAGLTVPLVAGKTNTVKLLGGKGGVNVDYLTVTPLD
jgi:hypothetical protein